MQKELDDVQKEKEEAFNKRAKSALLGYFARLSFGEKDDKEYACQAAETMLMIAKEELC